LNPPKQQSRPIAHARFRFQIRQEEFYGPLRDPDRCRNFVIAQALRKEADNFNLPLRKRGSVLRLRPILATGGSGRSGPDAIASVPHPRDGLLIRGDAVTRRRRSARSRRARIYGRRRRRLPCETGPAKRFASHYVNGWNVNASAQVKIAEAPRGSLRGSPVLLIGSLGQLGSQCDSHKGVAQFSDDSSPQSSARARRAP
jgi:hypothetical protein